MKIYPGLVRSTFLITSEDHSWRIWLWETQEDLKRWAERYAAGSREPGQYDDTDALHSPMDSLFIDGPKQHLGEIHFVKDQWELEHVAHEMLHAMFHYIRVLVPDFSRALYRDLMGAEENLCYPFGEWVDWVYRWLWKFNPNPKWVKIPKED